MLKRVLIISMVANSILLSNTGAIEQMWASEETSQEAGEQQIYGSHLMTEQERTDHRAKMRAAATDEERERIRREHHELMEQRARERGLTLPDEPPARQQGAGQGPASGDGRRGR